MILKGLDLSEIQLGCEYSPVVLEDAHDVGVEVAFKCEFHRSPDTIPY